MRSAAVERGANNETVSGERLIIYCQTTSVSAAHATHCVTYMLYPVSTAHTSTNGFKLHLPPDSWTFT